MRIPPVLTSAARRRIGPYRVLRELGAGAMASVYLAEAAAGELPLGPVALKVLHRHLGRDDRALERFRREAELGRRIRHGNVARVLDAGAATEGWRNYRYIALEYVDGWNLREVFAERGLLPEPLLLRIARDAAAGLAAIHALGALHRDIKPENLMLGRDGRVRVIDLGVAATGIADGDIAGSPAYIAPEQFLAEPPGPAGDLYALGVTLYELATGENPFHKETPSEALLAHLSHVPRAVCEARPGSSRFVSDLCARLLEKEPEARPSSARALQALLRGDAWIRHESMPAMDLASAAQVNRWPAGRPGRGSGRGRGGRPRGPCRGGPGSASPRAVSRARRGTRRRSPS